MEFGARSRCLGEILHLSWITHFRSRPTGCWSIPAVAVSGPMAHVAHCSSTSRCRASVAQMVRGRLDWSSALLISHRS